MKVYEKSHITILSFILCTGMQANACDTAAPELEIAEPSIQVSEDISTTPKNVTDNSTGKDVSAQENNTKSPSLIERVVGYIKNISPSVSDDDAGMEREDKGDYFTQEVERIKQDSIVSIADPGSSFIEREPEPSLIARVAGPEEEPSLMDRVADQVDNAVSNISNVLENAIDGTGSGMQGSSCADIVAGAATALILTAIVASNINSFAQRTLFAPEPQAIITASNTLTAAITASYALTAIVTLNTLVYNNFRQGTLVRTIGQTPRTIFG
ncbi:MAG: hypothetical protein LBF84_00590 [Holosporales bacterium]|jgi:hypothetical protein|nr:hypothetical protein [Holosporales bacterium]